MDQQTNQEPKAKSKHQYGREPVTAYKNMTPSMWAKFKKKYENEKYSLTALCRLHRVNPETAKTKKRREGWKKRDGVVQEKLLSLIDGSPSTFRQEYCQMMTEYFHDHEPYREVETSGGRIQLVPNKIKTLAGFAALIKVNRHTVTFWATQRDEDGELVNRQFNAVFQSCLAANEHALLSCGLAGVYNPAITSMALVNHHFYAKQKDEPIDNASAKQSANALDDLYFTALETARTLQSTVENNYLEVTGQSDPNAGFYRGNPNMIEAEFEEVRTESSQEFLDD